MELDSVTMEVLSRKLAAITDEMYFAVQRAARSSYVKEAADFATALLDPQGNVFAYPPSATFAVAAKGLQPHSCHKRSSAKSGSRHRTSNR